MQLLALLPLPFAAVVASLLDLTCYRIPNWLTVGLTLLFLPAAVLAGLSWHDILMHYGVGLAVLLVTFTLFSLGWFGGGDAKLAAAMACWMGLNQVFPFLLATSLAGGVLAFLIITFRWLPLPRIASGNAILLRLHDRKEGIPYGIALGAAALLVFPKTALWLAVMGAV